MTNLKHIKKILWCVEPLPRDTNLEKNFSHLLSYFSKTTKAKVFPVTYLHDLNPNTAEPLIKSEKQEVLGKISIRLEKYNISNLQKPFGIFDSVLGFTSKQVQLILKHAEKNKYDLICLQSKAQSKRDKFFIGSFAETMSLTSKSIPLLISNPSLELKQGIKTILLPIDFVGNYSNFFKKVLNIASQTKSKVLGLYIVQVANESNFLMKTTKREVEDLADSKLASLQKEIRSLEKMAQSLNIEFIFYPTMSTGKSTSEDILGFANKNQCDLITMQSHAGRTRAFILGSTSRQVLRGAKSPVLTIHA